MRPPSAMEKLGELAWEARRRLVAAGIHRALRVPARVVSVGNLSVGGTGKTTLTRHLAAAAHARGLGVEVVLRRYRPGPAGEGDEERLLRATLPGVPVRAGSHKATLAAEAAAAGARLVLVDDGFSHWDLERDLDLVLVDVSVPLESARLLPAGRLREPWRALQRADFVIASRLAPGDDGAAALEWLAQRAPGARFAAGRHRVTGARTTGGAAVETRGPVRVVTATGNPESVEVTAREAGFTTARGARYRDHHWFSAAEARREVAAARADGARVLLTAKDAVRWPLPPEDGTLVLEVEWEWVRGGEAVERAVFGEAT